MLNIKFLEAFFLLLLFHNDVFGMSLWNQVVKKEQVFLTVEYEKRYLNVWRQDSHGYSKFYVTPLCVMEIDSINCLRDEYSHAHRHIFGFNIKLWDSKATKVVQNALKQMNVNSSLSNILPLPMEMVRIGLGGTNLTVEVDNQWRSNQDQPHVMDFEFYTRHEHFCNKMISDAKNNTKHFLRAIKPYFEFMMVVRQHETRNFNVTGKSLQNSSFFSELANNTDNKDGIVFLQSKDLNRLTHNIYNKVAFEEEVSADYISSNQEKEIINELFEVLKNQQIQSKDLTKNEWNSVFWEDIYARPDIQADYANEVLKYNENENKFKYDSEKDQKFRENINRNKPKNKKVQKEQFNWFGELFPLGKFPNENKVNNENGEDTKKNEKETVSFDDLKKTLNKENINVKWNGIKFEPKNLKLYRLNTKKLNLSNGLYFKSIVVTNQKTIQQKIEIKAEPKIMLPLTTVMNTEIKSAASNLNPSICPDSWIYYNTTGFCYKVIRQNTTWGDAEKLCVEKESHLASVHSYNENLFITYLANDFTTICDWSGQAWIGLSRADVTSLNFEWTDGSLYGYKSWIRGDSHGSKNNCAALWIGQSCYGENWSIAATHWNPYPCDSKVKNVICKKAPNIQTKNGECHTRALGMETGEIGDKQISASSSFDLESVGPQNARIRTEKASGAWCPKSQIKYNSYEFLQISLNSTHIIQSIETQGRYANGTGSEYVNQYYIDYFRSGEQWIRYKNRTNHSLLSGNTDITTAVLQTLDPPIISSKIRIVPHSKERRTVCLRVELHGCKNFENHD